MSNFVFASDIGYVKVTVPGFIVSKEQRLELFKSLTPVLSKGSIKCDECGSFDIRLKGSCILEYHHTLYDFKFTCQGCGHVMHSVISSDPRKSVDLSQPEG